MAFLLALASAEQVGKPNAMFVARDRLRWNSGIANFSFLSGLVCSLSPATEARWVQVSCDLVRLGHPSITYHLWQSGRLVQNLDHQEFWITARVPRYLGSWREDSVRDDCPLSGQFHHSGHTCDIAGMMSWPSVCAHNAFPVVTYHLWHWSRINRISFWMDDLYLFYGFATLLKWRFWMCLWALTCLNSFSEKGCFLSLHRTDHSR